MVSNVITAIFESEEILQAKLVDISNSTESQILSNRKATMDQVLEYGLDKVGDLYDSEMDRIKSTLTEEERLRLQTMGIVDESLLEQNERARKEALAKINDAENVSKRILGNGCVNVLSIVASTTKEHAVTRFVG